MKQSKSNKMQGRVLFDSDTFTAQIAIGTAPISIGDIADRFPWFEISERYNDARRMVYIRPRAECWSLSNANQALTDVLSWVEQELQRRGRKYSDPWVFMLEHNQVPVPDGAEFALSDGTRVVFFTGNMEPISSAAEGPSGTIHVSSQNKIRFELEGTVPFFEKGGKRIYARPLTNIVTRWDDVNIYEKP